MKPFELFVLSGKSANVWGCGGCGTVYSGEISADYCCRCVSCKGELPGKDKGGTHQRVYHKECLEKVRKEMRDKKVKLEDWDGPVSIDDRFFSSIDDLIERFLDDDSSLPEYAEVCVEKPCARAKVDWILDSFSDGWSEDYDDVELKGIPELTNAIEAFNKANEGLLMYVRDGRLVKIPKVEENNAE